MLNGSANGIVDRHTGTPFLSWQIAISRFTRNSHWPLTTTTPKPMSMSFAAGRLPKEKPPA